MGKKGGGGGGGVRVCVYNIVYQATGERGLWLGTVQSCIHIERSNL